MKEYMKLTGEVVIETWNKKGVLLSKETQKNLIVTTGKLRVADLIGIVSTGVHGFSHIAIRKSITGDSVIVADTELKSEVKRVAPTITLNSNQVVFEHTFTFDTGETFGIKEAGIFDDAVATGSTMLNRVIFSEKNVDVDTDLYIKFTITIS